MERRMLFNEAVELYDRRRPDYSAQLFHDIIGFAGIDGTKSVLEVGCGTGQATLPFLMTGSKVAAVEIGTNLAGYMLHKFKDYENLRMVNLPFEEFVCPPNSFDLLYSASAFHWIPAEIGYAKAYSIVKRGGALALFWNRPSVNWPEDPLHQRIQEIYRTLLPLWESPPSDREADYLRIDEAIGAAGFNGIERKLYHSSRQFSGQQYVELLDTYSDHRALPEDVRMRLYGEIKSAIVQAGDSLTVYDTVDLHLARKA